MFAECLAKHNKGRGGFSWNRG